MGEFDIRGADLKKILKSAEKAPIAFAYCAGKSPKEDYFGVDKRKPPKLLFKKAQEEGPTKKVAFGTASVKDSALYLTCEREVPSLAERLKKYLRSEKVGLDVRIEGADDAKPVNPDDAPKTSETKKPAVGAGDGDTVTVAEVSTDEDGDLPEDPNEPDDEDDIAAQSGDIERLIVAARKKSYFVAAMIGKEGIILKAHRRKLPSKLVVLAKKEGATPRGAWGTMSVAGKTLTITCEQKPPKSTAKKIKRMLMSYKLAMKVICCLASGEVVDSAEDEEAEGAEPSTKTVASNPMDALKDMKGDMLATAKTHSYAQGYLTDLYKNCAQAAKGQDAEKAERIAQQLQRALVATNTGPLVGGQLEGLVAGIMPSMETAQAEFSRIVDFLNPVLTTDHPKRAQVETSVNAYHSATEAEDEPGVLSAIGDLRRHEATIEDVGHDIGKDGAIGQPLSDETATWLSSVMESEVAQ